MESQKEEVDMGFFERLFDNTTKDFAFVEQNGKCSREPIGEPIGVRLDFSPLVSGLTFGYL